MDKIFNSKWFVRLISFLIAMMLFAMVNMDNITRNQPGVLPNVSTGSYTLEEVPLTAYIDEERFAVTEIPQTVQVNLRGPQSVLTLFQVTRPSYELFVDLQEREAGVHHVSVQHQGFPRDLTVSVVPQFVRVVIEEKQTISLPVNVDILNEDEVKEGYTVGTPIVTPLNVEITAAKSIIEKVAIAKAFVDVAGAEQTIEKGFPVKVYDDAGNELHLDVEPAVVDVKVPITSPFKEVPVKLNQTGELPKGVSIESITIDPKEITIYGPLDVINAINVIEGINLNLNEITESQTLQIPIPKPEGVEMVTPKELTVTVDLTMEEELLLEDVPISVNGLSDGLQAVFEQPEEKTVDIVVRGAGPLLQKITREDIQAYIELNQLLTGAHELEIQIAGPRNLEFQINMQRANIIIKEENSEE